MKEVILPELGEGIENASITFWYYKEGDTVKEKEDLVELSTDKVAFNLPSPASGLLTQILLKEGDVARVGEVIAIIND